LDQAGKQQASTSHQVPLDSPLLDSLRLFDVLGCFGFCALQPGFSEDDEGFADVFRHGEWQLQVKV
jgi:hypothetical protein